MYNVLWIDDQCNDQELKQFIIKAYNNGIKLNGYPSYEEGFEVLESNLEKYDAILLDGMFFEKKGQQKGTEDELGLGRAIAKINELKNRKVFPWFVLSGKESFTTSENLILTVNEVSCFDKSKSSHVLQLFEEMKKAAQTQSDFQLKHQYNNILEVCDDRYIGTNQFKRVFSLIKDIENKGRIDKTGDLLNPIRKIIEALFGSLRDIGIIPSEVKSINRSSCFLANRYTGYIHASEFIHPMVAENLCRLINITQDGSHGEGELKLRVDEYLQINSSDFLYKSTVYLLFDILIWFKKFIDKHPDAEYNKKLWENKLIEVSDWILGSVVRIDENNWGTFEPINTSEAITLIPQMIEKYELEVDDYIKVITEPSPDGRKLHIKAISKEV